MLPAGEGQLLGHGVDPLGARQGQDLHRHGGEGRQVDEPQEAQKHPGHQAVAGAIAGAGQEIGDLGLVHE